LGVLPLLAFLPLALTGALAGSVSLPHEFQPGTPADANEVNANFTALAEEVNDNHVRIKALESATTERSIHITARALGVFLGEIVPNAYGLRWPDDGIDAAFAFLDRPADYDGGDVKVRLIFQTHGTGDGTVDFFLRWTSVKSGDDWSGRTEIQGAPADTTGSPSYSLHVQEIPVPAGLVGNPIWACSIHRSGPERDTSTDDVSLVSVDVVYGAR